MSLYRKALRLWLIVSSFVAFLVGWAFISNTEESETVIVEGNRITIEQLNLPAIPSVNGVESNVAANSDVQIFSVAPVTAQSSGSGLRTGGS